MSEFRSRLNIGKEKLKYGRIRIKLCDPMQLSSRHDNFVDLGGHFLLVIHFISKAKLSNMEFDASGVFSFSTLKNLAKLIAKHSKRFYCDAAIPVRQYGEASPLFLLHDGMGNISFGFELAHDIDKNITVYVLPWPSPESEQPSSIEEMASSMIVHIKKTRPNGLASPKCAIAGYSSGGIISYEITKQLTNSGYPVSFLGLIDTYAALVNPVSETKMFLLGLRQKFSSSETFKNAEWWANASKMTVNEAIEEIHKTDADLNRTDIEWDALLSKQRYNYENLCSTFRIGSCVCRRKSFYNDERSKESVSFREKIIKIFTVENNRNEIRMIDKFRCTSK